MVEFLRAVGVPFLLKMTGFNPIDNEVLVNGHGSVLQALDDR